MKKLQIVRVDNDLVEKADLQVGNNIIGRGAITGRADGPSVKHAVTINLSSNDEMTITPYQVAPCYMKTTESSRWQLLKLGSTVPIKPGDVCSLLAEKCWFKVVSVPDTMESNHDQTSKRKADEGEDSDIPDKKLCSEVRDGGDVPTPSDILNEMLNSNNVTRITNGKENTNCKATSNNGDAISMISEIKDNYDSSPTNDDETRASSSKLTSESQSADQTASEKDIPEREDININKMAASVFPSDEARDNFKRNLEAYLKDQNNSPNVVQDVSSPVPMQVDEPSVSAAPSASVSRREKCVYDKKCYRKNAQHRARYCHPGDSDYDAPDDREECPYGIRCYRKNPQHKAQFKHSAPKRGRKRVASLVISRAGSETEDLSAEESYEESVDESDYEPSSDVESSGDESYSEKNESEWEDGTTG